MKILKLIIKNFRSFSNKETEIEINNKFNIFVGENGSGKTSIIYAIRYALFGTQGMDIKVEELVNNINKDNMSVTLICEKDGEEIVIKRGRIKKQSFVKVWINDKELDLPSVKEYDKKIEEIIGFNYKMFEYFSINSQIFTNNFFKMKKNERDTFLKKVIGIEDFYLLIDKFREVKKRYEYKKEALEKESLVYQNLLKEKKNRLLNLEPNLNYSSIQNLQKEREEKQKQKKAIEEKLERLINAIKKEEELKKFIAKKEILIKNIQEEKKELNKSIDKESFNKIVEEIERLKKIMDNIKKANSNRELIRKAKQRLYQKILSLNAKKESVINKLDKVTSAVEAIRQRDTYLNRITKGDLESFVKKYGDSIVKFLFIADKRFYFEREKVFKSAKIELEGSNILKEYNEFKNKILQLLKNPNHSVLANLEKEKEDLVKKYKGFIKPLFREIREIKAEGSYEDYQTKLEKLLEEKSEIEKQLKTRKKIEEEVKKVKKIETEIEKLKKYEGTLQEYNKVSNLLNKLNNELLELETEYKKYQEVNEIKREIEKYQKKFEDENKVISEYEIKIKKCNEIIKKDSKKAITEATEDFLKIFNYYIQKYIRELDIKFSIKIKNDFLFLLKERGKVIDYSTLSKGEETILNLLLIFSLNETLKVISNIDFNLLIFDEIDGTLDEKNLRKVIEKLAELRKDIIFVSHRKEIFELEENLKNIILYEVKKDLFTELKKKKFL